jgi:hypothetical protein
VSSANNNAPQRSTNPLQPQMGGGRRGP